MQVKNSLFDVSGKVALVTGATGGFGAAVSKGLAKAGVKVMATGRSMETLAPLVARFEDAGGTAASVAGRPGCARPMWCGSWPKRERLSAVSIF